MHIQLAPTFYLYKYVLKMLKALVQTENEVLNCQDGLKMGGYFLY